MQTTEPLRLSDTRLSYFSLPFSLPGAALPAEPPLALVMSRLDVLHQLSQDTRKEIDLLRIETAQVLQLLSSSPAAESTATVPTGTSVGKGEEPSLYFRLFGGFEVSAGGRTLTRWTARKSRLLLAYLAVESKRLVPKEVLIELFWPESTPARGSNNLSIAIFNLRTWLKDLVPTGNHGVCVQQGLYGLDPDTSCWVDVEEFRLNLTQARSSLQRGDEDTARGQLAAAADLYRGDFLESDLYEEWTIEPRRTLGESYRWALSWLTANAAGRDDWTTVLDYGERMVRHDPCDEEGHRQLMRAHWRTGNRGQALQQYRICSERLQEELGVEPSDETQNLLLAIGGQH